MWHDLVSLGELERDSPIHQDVYQVTTEIMVRVEQNLNTIVTRLKSVDYRFVFPEEIHVPPGKHIGQKIQELESLVGPLPLSLRAWYQILGPYGVSSRIGDLFRETLL